MDTISTETPPYTEEAATSLGDCLPLTGRGRFETLADTPLKYHLRHSSLTERTLLGYTLICVMLATCLAIMGTELVYHPSRAWLFLLVIPVGALYILRYNGEVLVDAQRRVVHLKIRRMGFMETACTVPFAAIRGVRVEVANGVAGTVLATTTGTRALLERVIPGVAGRLADRIGSLAGVGISRDADVLPPAPRTAPAQTADPGALEALQPVEVPGGFGVRYRTVSPGTSAVLLAFSGSFGPLAALFLYWAVRILINGPVTVNRVMLLVPPSALLVLCSMLFYAGLCLACGEEELRLIPGTLEGRVYLLGRWVRTTTIELATVREVRVDGGIKILFGHEGIHRMAATLPEPYQQRLCHRIHSAWLAVV
jgi:hypothetical protein